jgi:hypothetical protein
MAKMEVQLEGKKLMRGLTLHVDMGKVERECFGRKKWRLHVAKALIWLAAHVLRTPVKWDTKLD